jgi:hypothetical protein
MPISVYYDAPATLVGDAAFNVGLGEYVRAQEEQALREAQLAEQARQFDASLALRERGLDADIASDQLRLNLAANQERTRRFAIQQQGALAQQNDAARLAAIDLQGQYGLADQAMRNQAMFEAEALQQLGLAARQQDHFADQVQQQRREFLIRRMEADWENIVKALPRLDPAERDELIGKFEERYQFAGLPMPMQLPPAALPEWMDPEIKLDRARELYPDAPWQLDHETGDVGLPRGWNYQMSPGWQAREAERQERELQNKLEIERMRQEQRAAADDARRAFEAEQNDLDRQARQSQTELGTRSREQLANRRLYETRLSREFDRIVNDAESGERFVDAEGNIDWDLVRAEKDRVASELARQFSMNEQLVQPGATGGDVPTYTTPADLYATPEWQQARPGTVFEFRDAQGRLRQVVKQ